MKKSELIMNLKWQRLRFSAKFLYYMCTQIIKRKESSRNNFGVEGKEEVCEEKLDIAEPRGIAALDNFGENFGFGEPGNQIYKSWATFEGLPCANSNVH